MKIIYKIYYQNDLITANLSQIEQEHRNIYGEFNIVAGNQCYLPYPTEEQLGKNPELFSELLLTHFEQLNIVARTFEEQNSNYVAIRYIESPWVWLEFKRINDLVYVSEIYLSDGDIKQLISYEEHHFTGSRVEEGFSICITIAELLIEVNTKTNIFIEELKRLNPILIESSSIKNFLRNSRRRDIR
jgi:hypothetical protein